METSVRFELTIEGLQPTALDHFATMSLYGDAREARTLKYLRERQVTVPVCPWRHGPGRWTRTIDFRLIRATV